MCYMSVSKKSIKSRDGKIEVKYDEVTHVCIAHNYFPLLQYILLMPDEIVFHHTYYFLIDYLPVSLRNMLPCSSYVDGKTTFFREVDKRIHKLLFRYLKYIQFPFLRTAEIYAYDTPYFNILIGRREYNLLADAPNWLTLNMQEHSTEYIRQLKRSASFLGKVQRMVYGDIFVDYFGNNKNCKTIYLTEENVSPVLEGKRVIVNSLQELWDSSTESKKCFVKNLFGISNEDIDLLNSRPIVFFSQPVIGDCGLTEDECVDVHRKIFNNYNHSQLIVKRHPRDKFNFHKYFPDIEVYSKPVNSQLLGLLGVLPVRMVTICSSAIESMPETIECDFYGTSIHPKIKKYLGDKYLPKRKVNFCNAK